MLCLYHPLFKSGHLPVIFAIVFVINLAFTYIVAVVRGDVDPLFPYVSAAADHRPESCFFSALLNISSALSALIILLRSELVKRMLSEEERFLLIINKISLFFGLLGAFGMFIVANFQETAVIAVHLLAACVTFAGSCIYMLLQSFITIKMHPSYANRKIGYIRLALALFGTVCFFTAVSFGWYAAHVFHQYYPNLPTPRPWTSKMWQPGYNYHVRSAFAEWSMALSIVAYILSYSRDFEKFEAKLVVERLVVHLDHSPMANSYEDLRADSYRHAAEQHYY